jgi:hypothetical protein
MIHVLTERDGMSLMAIHDQIHKLLYDGNLPDPVRERLGKANSIVLELMTQCKTENTIQED